MNARLSPGTPAPDFEAIALGGGTIRLDLLRGKKVWLAFYRYASCPLCNMRVAEMVRLREALGPDAPEMIAVFQATPASLARYAGKRNPPITLIPDAGEKLYAAYRLESGFFGYFHPVNLGPLLQALRQGHRLGAPEGTFLRLPADFLIDEQGVIRDAFYATRIRDHIPLEQVQAFARGR